MGSSIDEDFYFMNNTSNGLELIEAAKDLGITIDAIRKKDLVLKDGENYIVNLDDNGSGSHWVACCRMDNTVYYFDSFGLPPIREIEEIPDVEILYNNSTIQHDNSTSCGWYCLKFLDYMNRDPSNGFADFVYDFSPSQDPENEDVIQDFIDEI